MSDCSCYSIGHPFLDPATKTEKWMAMIGAPTQACGGCIDLPFSIGFRLLSAVRQCTPPECIGEIQDVCGEDIAQALIALGHVELPFNCPAPHTTAVYRIDTPLANCPFSTVASVQINIRPDISLAQVFIGTISAANHSLNVQGDQCGVEQTYGTHAAAAICDSSCQIFESVYVLGPE